jgi:hypothetical protein
MGKTNHRGTMGKFQGKPMENPWKTHMQPMVLEYLYTHICPCPKSPSHVGKYTIHGAYGMSTIFGLFDSSGKRRTLLAILTAQFANLLPKHTWDGNHVQHPHGGQPGEPKWSG